MALLELHDVRKSFRDPEGEAECILDVPRFEVAAGERVALVGASGSGKTTFLHVIAGLLKPDEGRVLFDGADLTELSEARRDALRARNLGYVFQSFHLLQGFSALENVVLGMAFGPGPDRAAARALLERLGLGHRLHHRPAQLSVGQQQRVALARALANRPRLVLADEPTGNLDPERAREALATARELCEECGAALLVVTHDAAALESFERVVPLDDINRAGAARAVDAPEANSAPAGNSARRGGAEFRDGRGDPA